MKCKRNPNTGSKSETKSGGGGKREWTRSLQNTNSMASLLPLSPPLCLLTWQLFSWPAHSVELFDSSKSASQTSRTSATFPSGIFQSVTYKQKMDQKLTSCRRKQHEVICYLPPIAGAASTLLPHFLQGYRPIPGRSAADLPQTTH
jgi:hypothetical protein